MRTTINDLSYHIETSGQGEQQILLLHYFGGRGSTWKQVMKRLRTYRCFAPDLAGFGDTQAPQEAYTVDQQAEDIAELIDTLELDDFALAGHSMGGKLALAVAALRPPGLNELVLVAPSPPTPEPMTDQQRQQMLDLFGDQAAIEAHLRGIVGLELPADLLEQAVAENMAVSEVAWQGWLREGSREDISAYLEQISVPVTILFGERDSAIDPELATSAITPYLTSTSAKVTVLPELGHLLPYEAPLAIVDALTDDRAL